jgi:hypothetical protein
MEDEGEVENIGRKPMIVSSKCHTEGGNCEDIESEVDDRNDEKSKTGEADQRLVTSGRKLTDFINNSLCNIYFLSCVCSKIMILIYKISFS